MSGRIVIGAREVGRLGFGALHIKAAPDPSRLLRRALELGLDHIDTADVYDSGENELLVAAGLHPYPPGVLIATKVGLTRTAEGFVRVGRPEYLREAVDGSLRRLRLECLELVYLHFPDKNVPYEESIGALAGMREAGKLRHIGVSNVTVDDLRRARAVTEIAAVEDRFGPDFLENAEVLAECERLGLPFVAWGPLRGKDSPAETLRWLLERSPVLCPIPGTSSIAHLEENVRAAAGPGL